MYMQEIDCQPLFDWFNETLKTNVKFQIVWEGDKPTITPNLKEFTGVLRNIVDSAQIEMFNFECNESRLIANFQIVLKYRYEDMSTFYFGRAVYVQDLNWVFESYQPGWLD